jgi:serine phosphatase RsbU (regulator of sigma subunit)
LLLRADGGVEHLAATRTPLGLGIGGGFDVHKAALNRGDRLAFYTDGISEAANGDATEFGADELLASLAERRFARSTPTVSCDLRARARSRSRQIHR